MAPNTVSFAENNRKYKPLIRYLAIGLITILVAVAFALLLLVLLKETDKSDYRLRCPLKKAESREECLQRGCLWKPSDKRSPSCYFPVDDIGYYVDGNATKSGAGFWFPIRWRSRRSPPFKRHIHEVKVEVTFVNSKVVRLRLTDAAAKRYQVPIKLNVSFPDTDPYHAIYEVKYDQKYGQRFNLKIIRRGVPFRALFDTTIGGLLLSDQFLQIASHLPSPHVYGLGENSHATLKRALDYRVWPLFARSEPDSGFRESHFGAHPFYTVLEKDGKSHGVLLLNSNALEVELLPKPGVIFRTLGGELDLCIFVGDSPEEVIQLYTEVVGRPFLPPFWALGFHLSGQGYNTLDELKKIIERTRSKDLPLDAVHLSRDYMEQKRDFTFDKLNFKDLPVFVKNQHKKGLKFVALLDPAINADMSYKPFKLGSREEVFITWPPHISSKDRRDPPQFNSSLYGDSLFGTAWPQGPVVFPDFFKNSTTTWWTNLIGDLYQEVNFDGLSIDMNKPTNFGTNEDKPFYCTNSSSCWSLKCPVNELDDPQVIPTMTASKRLSDKTICMVSLQGDKKQFYHYDVHSLYGLSQSEVTLHAAQKAISERSLVISRSTFPSSGQFAGHWLGDTFSSWDDLRKSIVGIIEFNLFGIPFVGADVCGFNGNTSTELCSRWMQLGAFYPFFRINNGFGNIVQDPGAIGERVVTASKKALLTRYELLPHLHTLFYQAHVKGNTVIRPLFHEYSRDAKTRDIGEQFLWGCCLLFSPVLEQDAKIVKAYFPQDTWFDWYSGVSFKSTGQFKTLTSIDVTPIHVRGGTVIPTFVLDPFNGTSLNTQTCKDLANFSLRVYPKKRKAKGTLFWENGFSLDSVSGEKFYLFSFTLINCSLAANVNNRVKSGSKRDFGSMILENVIVYGVERKPVKAVLRQKDEENKAFNYNPRLKSMKIHANVRLGNDFKIEWVHENNACL